MRRLAPVDARFHWQSAVIGNDQFLLYCFAGQPIRLDDAAAMLRRRTRTIGDLTVRILDVPGTLDRPYWVYHRPDDDQVTVHRDLDTWQQCLDRLAVLMGAPLDPTRAPWRVHLFGPIADPPAGSGVGVVAVLQICHALADGRGASGIARKLFTDSDSGPDLVRGPVLDRLPAPVLAGGTAALGVARLPVDLARTVIRGTAAYRASRSQPAVAASGVPPTDLNRPPSADRLLRTIVGPRDLLPPGHTVTVGALTAISLALDDVLDDRLGGAPLAVELTVGRSSETRARNNFRNVGVDLHTELDDLTERAAAIAKEIDRARDADRDPTRVAERRATDASPAMLTRWGIRQFDVEVRPESMTGVSVVSSVYRGRADLTLDGAPVVCTAGFPALSPAQGLTHGVHGIGDTVTLSVTTSPAIMPDVDRYLESLSAAIDRVRREVRRPDQLRPGQERGG
ncbi:WS/DGAT domain-containing protein [Gordonia sp. CPCC 205515]|uniref:WS/DGAT domain-containing protein n=1 Tax=Gordonia sp. CPCC 205515 TaxID=3140791 RepID=UPI003AF3AD52